MATAPGHLHLLGGRAPLSRLTPPEEHGPESLLNPYQNLLRSPCREVSVIAEVMSKDARSTTAANLPYVSAITGLNCSTADKMSIKAALPIEEVPESERWRLGLLDSLLSERDAREKDSKDVKRVISMLGSLCNT